MAFLYWDIVQLVEHSAVNRNVASSSLAIPAKRKGDFMSGSQIASEIDYDYKMRKKYGRKRAKKCKEKECMECKLKESKEDYEKEKS